MTRLSLSKSLDQQRVYRPRSGAPAPHAKRYAPYGEGPYANTRTFIPGHAKYSTLIALTYFKLALIGVKRTETLYMESEK